MRIPRARLLVAAIGVSVVLAGCVKPTDSGSANPAAPVAPLPSTGTDAKLADAVGAALAAEPLLKGVKLTVEVKDGRVSLSGQAPSSEAKQKAEDIVRAMDEVYGVETQQVVVAE